MGLLHLWPGGYPIPGHGYPPSGTGVHPWKGPGPVTGVPPGKDMGPVEVLWDGDEVNPLPPTPHMNRQTPVKTVPMYYACGQ